MSAILDPPAPVAPRKPRSVAMAVLLTALIVWSAWFVWRTSFYVRGKLHFCLADDALITMSYARNLLDGHGLNWARFGAPVEGYSHPLWLLIMIPANLVPIALRWKSLIMQIVSLATLIANLYVVRSLMLRHFSTERTRSWLPAVALTAFCQPLDFWALLGMESGLQALFVTASIHLALDICAGRPRHRLLFIVLTLASLLRHDMLILVVTILAYVAWQKGFRRGERKDWLLGAALFVGANLAYLAFRWWYFGALLPNTYDLKMTGFDPDTRIVRGAFELLAMVRRLLPLLLVVVIGAVPLIRTRPAFALLLAVLAVHFLYSAWVGGDAWEDAALANRFICFVLPVLFVALNALMVAAFDHLAARRGDGRPLIGEPFVAGGVTLLAFLIGNGLLWADRTDEAWKRLIVADRPQDQAMMLRRLVELEDLKTRLPAHALVAVTWAGLSSYFTDFRLIDCLGYNDRVIARSTPEQLLVDRWQDYRPGHLKADYDYVLAQNPDALFRVAVPAKSPLESKLKKLGYAEHDYAWLRTPPVTSPATLPAGAPASSSGPARP